MQGRHRKIDISNNRPGFGRGLTKGENEMNAQQRSEWLARNIDAFGSEEEAIEYLESRLARQQSRQTRVLRVFRDRSEYNEYAENHNMGQDWDYNSADFNGEYGDEYRDYVAVCAYEYQQ